MSIQSISIEDVRALIQQLRRSQETIESDWNSVMIKWQNLQDSWKDSQRHQFEAMFEDLHRTCHESGRQQEEYIQLLENLIHKAEDAMAEGLIDIPQSLSTPSSGSGLSTSNKEPSAFAKSLSYGHIYGGYEPSFEKNDYATLEAYLPNTDNSSDCRISYQVEDSGRIKISNIDVPLSYRRQGIATLLFQDLESRVPAGSTFYFTENQNRLFWLKQGFLSHKTEDGRTEYRKKVTHP